MTTTSKSATAPPRLAATISVVLPTTPDGIESLPIPGPAGVQACVRAWAGGADASFRAVQCALVGVCGLCTHSHLGIFPLCMSTLLSGYRSRGSSTRYLKCAHGSTWGTQWDSGALKGCSTTHAPDGATVGTKVVGASVLFMGEGVGAGDNSGVGVGVTTVGVGVGGAGGTAQRWTARQIAAAKGCTRTHTQTPTRTQTCALSRSTR